MMTMWTWGYAAQQCIMLGLWLILLWAAYKEIRRWNTDENEVFTSKKRYRRSGGISSSKSLSLEVRPSLLQEKKFLRRFPS
jgi:hypothetical protein